MIYQPSNPALITAVAAVFGSVVGALGSTASSWVVHRHQNRRELTARKIFHREQLYSDFISETAQATADAMQHTLRNPGRLIDSYALLSRMRLSSSIAVVQSAEQVIQAILETYAKPNLSPEEFQAWARDRNDPLRGFSEICRQELESLWSHV